MRPSYISSKLLSARDLNDEQADLLQRLRRHDRFMHGYGILCGLRVYASPDRQHPWTVGVCPGYAIDPCGNEIEVPRQVSVDIRDFFWSRPYVNGVGLRAAFVALRFTDDAGTTMDFSSACECGCNSASTHPSSMRIRDGYAVEILWAVQARPAPKFDLCGQGPVPCPSPPVSHHVVLAKVHLPALESTWLTDAGITEV
jgi:hypothetical protein